jgi:competence protein ComEC
VPLCISLIGGLLCAAVAFPPVIIAGAMLLGAAGRGRHHLLRCSLCILALMGGWSLEKSARPSAVIEIAEIPTELHLEGRLLALPESDSEGGCTLRVRGSRLTVLLKVASSPESALGIVQGLRTGDTVRVWCRLRRPRGYANPGAMDPAIWLHAKGLDAVGTVKSARLVELIERGTAGPRRWLDDAKYKARLRLDRSFGSAGNVRAIMGAMVLGDRGGLSPGQGRALRHAGLLHLVAISGLHAGLLAMLLFGGLRRARFAPWLLCALALLLFPAFGVAVGSRPPVLRAAAATILILFGRWCGREGDSFNSLALVACAFLIFDPGLLRDASFQLTFLATAGILLMGAPLAARLPLPAPLALTTAVSAAAYLGCAPLLAHHFGWLAPVALLSNIAAAPLCAAIIISGYGCIVLAGLPVIHEAMAALGGLSVALLLRGASLAGGLPFAGWRVPAPGFVVSLLYYLLLGGLLARSGDRWRRVALLLLALFLILLVWLHVGAPLSWNGRLRAAVLDVGQGQSVLVQGSHGRSALLDAAGTANPRFDPGERLIVPLLSSWNIRRIDLLVISHGDIDHAGGAFAILREMEVGELWLAPGYHRHPLLLELAAQARIRGAAVVLAERGRRTNSAGLPIEVLGPGRSDAGLSGNDRSLVLRIGERPCRLLIPGDLERAGEDALISAGLDLQSEALVVAHHGSAGGSGASFLARVRPLHAVVSCGFANRFNLPSPDVVRRIEHMGASLRRTDRDGMLLLESGRTGWRVRSTRRRERRAPE